MTDESPYCEGGKPGRQALSQQAWEPPQILQARLIVVSAGSSPVAAFVMHAETVPKETHSLPIVEAGKLEQQAQSQQVWDTPQILQVRLIVVRLQDHRP